MKFCQETWYFSGNMITSWRALVRWENSRMRCLFLAGQGPVLPLYYEQKP